MAQLVRTGSWLAGIAVLLLTLVWPAIYNGQPIFLEDTTAYIRGFDAAVARVTGRETVWTAPVRQAPNRHAEGESTAHEVVLAGRSVYYGALLYLGHITGGLWLSVLLQSAAIFVAVALCMSHLRVFSGRAFSVTVVGLALFTPIAFFASLLVPDVFAGLAILTVANLAAFGDRLSLAEGLVWTGLLCATLLFHTSHLALVSGLLACLLLGRACGFTIAKSGLFRIAVAIAIGLLGEIVFMKGVETTTGSSPIRPPFLMARVIADGPGTAFLKANCPKANFAVCQFVDRLPVPHSDVFLWSTDPKEGGVFMTADAETRRALSDEEIRFVLATIAFDPIGQGRSALRNTIDMLGMISLNEFSYEIGGGKKFGSDRIPVTYLDVMAKTKAWVGALPTRLMSRVTTLVAIASAAFVIGGMLLFRNRVDREPRWLVLCAVVFLGVVGNAIVCGATSAPRDRYQARVVWLIPLTAVLFYERRRRQSFKTMPDLDKAVKASSHEA